MEKISLHLRPLPGSINELCVRAVNKLSLVSNDSPICSFPLALSSRLFFPSFSSSSFPLSPSSSSSSHKCFARFVWRWFSFCLLVQLVLPTCHDSEAMGNVFRPRRQRCRGGEQRRINQNFYRLLFCALALSLCAQSVIRSTEQNITKGRKKTTTSTASSSERSQNQQRLGPAAAASFLPQLN